MQVHHQTEHARNEGYHHRELAESEARRAEVLQRTSATLERLSAIGQEITAHLDAEAVFQALDRHIHGLLTADLRHLPDRRRRHILQRALSGSRLGQPLPPTPSPVNPRPYSVRCLNERREDLYRPLADAEHRQVVPGTMINMSALFAPLTVGERAIGVMTVQAPQSRAYGETSA
jgi:transcriptional regulator with GAF, ATPase, and Fis domain